MRVGLCLIWLSGLVWSQEHLAWLPPVPEWSGKTRSLAVAADDPWATVFEQTDMMGTSNYDQTVSYLRRLVGQAENLSMVSLGQSHQRRDIWMIIATADGERSADALKRNGKPTLLAQAGIHSGEIDGKDAGMMLLRDMVTGTKAKAHLLNRVNLLFVPIFSVDGHERISPNNRVNQRGPESMGWRTNARNRNLNRDYAKIDTPEMTAMVNAINHWQPDLYLDIHVTDGMDYQYDITYGANGRTGYSPNIAVWLEDRLFPYLDQRLEQHGHVPGPLVFGVDRSDVTKGIVKWMSSPRYSTGWGDARHLPTILVENHSLKPYDQRVLGTYVLIEEIMLFMASHGDDLKARIMADLKQRHPAVPLSFKRPAEPSLHMAFKAIDSETFASEISGHDETRWLGTKSTVEVPVFVFEEPDITVKRPKTYWVPAAWPDVINRLAVHGIEMEYIHEPTEVNVSLDRFTEFKFAEKPFEGRFRVSGQVVSEEVERMYQPGSVRISTDQPLGHLVILLLEPMSPDSFLQWGFFNEIFQRTEYMEPYVSEPLAKAMIAKKPQLKKDFDRDVNADEALAKDRWRRLYWFYDRSPYSDPEWKRYPVGRQF